MCLLNLNLLASKTAGIASLIAPQTISSPSAIFVIPLSPPPRKPREGAWKGIDCIVLLPPRLPGTAAPSPLTFPCIFAAAFKFGVFDVDCPWGTSCCKGDEWTGEVEGWDFDPASPPRVDVRGETRPVCRIKDQWQAQFF